MANWADLACDVLEHLTSFFTLADQNRFSAVCHNWRLVAKRKRHPPVAQLPWLVLGEDEQTKKRNFFNLSEKRLYSIDIPELYGQYVCGSSHGWLFTVDECVDERMSGRLLNPFTREFYELPPYPPYDADRAMPYEGPRHGPDGYRIGFTVKEMPMIIVNKAVLSHDPNERSDFTAMIVFGVFQMLAIWRPGEKSWTVINPKGDDHMSGYIYFCDVIFFNGEFYALSCYHIYIVDVGSDPTLIKVEPLVVQKHMEVWRYFVDFEGKKLLVVQRLIEMEDENENPLSEPTTEFQVRQVRVVNRESRKLLETRRRVMRRIKKQALFVGSNSAVVVNPKMFPGCMENGIYFTDICVSEGSSWIDHGHDFGVYDMVDETIDETMGEYLISCDKDVFCPTNAMVIWFTPNP